MNTSSVFITSDPVGAKAYVEGDFVGNTPIKIPINATSAKILVKLNGYSDWEQKVNINKKSQNIVKASLVKMSGNFNTLKEKAYLIVKGNIIGWDVYVNGGRIGKTPLSNKIELEIGTHKISLFDDEHVFSQGTAMTDLKYKENQENAAIKNVFIEANKEVEIDIDSMVTNYQSVQSAHTVNATLYWGCFLIGAVLILNQPDDNTY